MMLALSSKSVASQSFEQATGTYERGTCSPLGVVSQTATVILLGELLLKHILTEGTGVLQAPRSEVARSALMASHVIY